MSRPLVMAAAASIMLLACGSVSVADARVRAQPIEAITSYEIWNSNDPERVANGSAVLMLFRADPEAAVSQGDGVSLGIVMVGYLGTGVEPVTIRLIAGQATDVAVERNERIVHSFLLRFENGQTMVVTIEPDGQVTVDQTPVGRVR